jgi:hypothetical protein
MNTNKDDKMVYIGLGSIVTTRPFSLFLKKNILIPNVAETNILISVEEKKLSDSEFLSYNLMLNSGKNKICLSIKNRFLPTFFLIDAHFQEN